MGDELRGERVWCIGRQATPFRVFFEYLLEAYKSTNQTESGNLCIEHLRSALIIVHPLIL